MRDFVALLLALFLLLVALSLAGALHMYRRRRQEVRGSAAARGRRIVAELPVGPELLLFTEDATHFYYGEEAIQKRAIRAARVLINGAPIASAVSARAPDAAVGPPASFEDRPEGIARDRWDVALELPGETRLVECGAIRERVSQELARRIFDAVRRAVEEEA